MGVRERQPGEDLDQRRFLVGREPLGLMDQSLGPARRRERLVEERMLHAVERRRACCDPREAVHAAMISERSFTDQAAPSFLNSP